MHMLSRKDLNSAELETVRISKSPTAVVTANGQVQTNEEATVHVNEEHKRVCTANSVILWPTTRGLVILRTRIREEKVWNCYVQTEWKMG